MSFRWVPIGGEPAVDGQQRVVIGLLGRGIAASRTPAMHIAQGNALGLNYAYHLIDTANAPTEPEPCDLVDWLLKQGYTGLNVTFPYKQTVMPCLDLVSDEAQAIGAVNTIVFQDGAKVGHNTDYWGFKESLKQGLPDAALETVLQIGAGGAGKAVSQALLDLGVGLLLVHDTDQKSAAGLVEQLARGHGADRVKVAGTLEEATGQADGIVNATPMGMDRYPGLPLPADLIEPRHWVSDIVYFPLETALLIHARKIGCQVLPGSGMAINQAVRAFELFTGTKADPMQMRTTFEAFDKGRVA